MIYLLKMYFFSNKYDKTINIDLIRKTNVLNYQKVCFNKGNYLSIHSQKRTKADFIHKALVLEILSLRKAFFYFEVNKSHKRKKTYVSTDTRVFLKNKVFFYNFSKNCVGLLKNLQFTPTKITSSEQLSLETEALVHSSIRTVSQVFSEILIKPSLLVTTRWSLNDQWASDDILHEQRLSFYKICL